MKALTEAKTIAVNLWGDYTKLSGRAQALVLGIVIVIILMFSGVGGSIVGFIKDKQFEQARAAEAAERTKMKEEIDDHISRMKELEKIGAGLKARIDERDNKIKELSSKLIELNEQKQQNQRKYKDERKNLDAITDSTALYEYTSKLLTELGFKIQE